MKKNLPILIALAALLVLGVMRYEHFADAYNITSFWRYNSMFLLISIGMAFVIITGGIDLSVGAVAALASVVSALGGPPRAAPPPPTSPGPGWGGPGG